MSGVFCYCLFVFVVVVYSLYGLLSIKMKKNFIKTIYMYLYTMCVIGILCSS